MVVEPRIRGFVCTTAHPVGCSQNVKTQIDYVRSQEQKLTQKYKKVLIIGASTGYGLASRIVAAFGMQADTMAVFYERRAEDKRTASAGWYNSAAFEASARKSGMYARSFNGDAFSAELKSEVIDCIKRDWHGQVDLIIYSLASPRRTMADGTVYKSVLKPTSSDFQSKTLDFNNGIISDVALEAATKEEVEATVQVMGGDDWQQWMEALTQADCLAPGATTVAYSYIGPELTYPIYRDGTIGHAKQHLEDTAARITNMLASKQGKALVSVNKALVTQASAAIPVVPLYISMLNKIMDEKQINEGCIEQIWRLFADYLCVDNPKLDSAGRIRLDDLELRTDVQQKIQEIWPLVNTSNLRDHIDLNGFRAEFYKLFGFGLDNLDYTDDVEINVDIPSLEDSGAKVC